MNLTDPGDLRYHDAYPGPTPQMMSASSMLPTGVHEDSERPDIGRPEWHMMREACEMPDDLLGGNRQMRKKALTWLPREEEESDLNWRLRVSRSTCFPFYRDTICDLAARPFGRDLSWGDVEPGPEFEEFLRDVDGTGKSFTVFARDTLLNAMHRGMDHVLVNVEAFGTGRDLFSTESRRVYATRIDSLSMLDIRDEVDDTGRRRITYCRFVTARVKDTDTFQQQPEVVIVELEKQIETLKRRAAPGKRVEWTFDTKSAKWRASPPSVYEPGKKGIPLFTIYTQQVGHYAAEPVLEDLAWVNLAHYQSRSDHAHVMRIARLITLVTLGFKSASAADPRTKGLERIKLGPLSRVSNPDPNAKVFFLEPSGKSIELSFQDMEQLADECKRLGARHLTSKTGNVTARAVTTDDQKTVNNLQTFCVRLELLLRQVMEAVAEWKGLELPEEVRPRVHKEFQSAGNIEGGARSLMAIKDALSPRQLAIEAMRYGILRPDFPVDENLAELEQQRAALDAAIAEAAGEVAVDPEGTNGEEPDPLDDDGDDDTEE